MKKARKKKVSKEIDNRKSGPVKSNSVPGLKKQYLKSREVCKVTFRLPKQAAPDASVVVVVGDFNSWNKAKTEMQKLKSGDFKVTLNLDCDQEYRFRYLIDQEQWENDWAADKYIPNEYGCEDSVVIV